MTNRKSQLFDDVELDTLVIAAASGGASEDDIMKFIRWAEMTRIGSVILERVLSREVTITITPDGSPKFKKVLDDRLRNLNLSG